MTKNIVLCLDGTGKAFSKKNTNVLKIFDCLEKNQPENQVVYYQTGVGTNIERSAFTPVTSTLSTWADLAFGWYLDSQVIDAYKFVQNNYNEGDCICVFGYSRGAYTARALCGFFHAIGLLPKWNTQQVDYAYQIWISGDKLACEHYKLIMCRDVDVEFVGCFDTVSSVGVLVPRVLPFSTYNGKTRVFRHALALDEYRAKFRQETWHYSLPDPPGSYQDWVWGTMMSPIRYAMQLLVTKEAKEAAAQLKSDIELLEESDYLLTSPTDIKEVWFAGGHGDIGGGTTSDFEEPSSLSNITLRWMLKEVFKSGSGILFDSEALSYYKLRLPKEDELWSDPDADTRLYCVGREKDVKSASHIASPLKWGVLEFLPVLERKQAEAGWILAPQYVPPFPFVVG
ncbi:hypothetical protein DL93DRAFT_665633 [Clavulina sp. PMI_390]|nr:hypothetical protein DL93DRAFT_665633 [Clavulina sp. PMI_390]